MPRIAFTFAATFFLLSMTAVVAAAAGNVTAEVRGGTLYLKGDELGNDIELDQAGLTLTEFRITGNATSINGDPGPTVFAGIAKDLRMDLGAGGNTLLVEGAGFAGDVVVRGGDDSDSVAIAGTLAANVRIDLREGSGSVTLHASSTIEGDVSLKGGGGSDSTFLNDSAVVGGDLNVDHGDGPGAVFLNAHCDVAGKVTYKAGDGSNSFFMNQETHAGSVSVDMGADPSSIFFNQDSTIDGEVKFKAATGPSSVFVNDGADLGSLSAIMGGGGSVSLSSGSDVGKVAIKPKNGFLTANFSGNVLDDVLVKLDDEGGYADLHDATFSGKVQVKGGDGVDQVFCDGASIGNDLKLILKEGGNSVTCLNATVSDDLLIKAGSGDDEIDTTGTTAGGTTKIDPDGGTNTVVP